MESLAIAFLAAAIAIYLLLLLLFNSVAQPVLVMLAIPFGLIGVIAAFALHGQAFGFLAMLGVIGLTGIVVNDSLILVNLANELHASAHGTFRECVIEAARRRLRPIILTSITTVAGLLPMAYGIGGSDPFSAPMALAMGYGILFATPVDPRAVARASSRAQRSRRPGRLADRCRQVRRCPGAVKGAITQVRRSVAASLRCWPPSGFAPPQPSLMPD